MRSLSEHRVRLRSLIGRADRLPSIPVIKLTKNKNTPDGAFFILVEARGIEPLS